MIQNDIQAANRRDVENWQMSQQQLIPAKPNTRMTFGNRVRLRFRSLRQPFMFALGRRLFGEEEVAHSELRALRLLEEAGELYQSVDGTVERAVRQMRQVFSRPKGDTKIELGSVGVCTLRFAESIGLDADQCERDEIARIMSMPAEKFTKRIAEKKSNGLGVKGSDYDFDDTEYDPGFFDAWIMARNCGDDGTAVKLPKKGGWAAKRKTFEAGIAKMKKRGCNILFVSKDALSVMQDYPEGEFPFEFGPVSQASIVLRGNLGDLEGMEVYTDSYINPAATDVRVMEGSGWSMLGYKVPLNTTSEANNETI